MDKIKKIEITPEADPTQDRIEEIVQELKILRAQLQKDVQNIFRVSSDLQRHARRLRETENISRYLSFSNGWLRFAGAINQGVIRTSHLDKLLPKKPIISNLSSKVPKEKREKKISRRWSPGSDLTDIVELYGLSVVDNDS
jgi:hypothetical protein